MAMQENNSARNKVLTPHHSQCRICHIAGYSNNCDYFSIAKCPVVTAMKDLKKQGIAEQ